VPAPFVTAVLSDAVARRRFPTLTLWSRVEGRPRAENFEGALAAEVRDALWMLARQWQMGEFRGDDAGSPVFARIGLHATRITRYQAAPDGAVEPFDETVPLETRVERRPIPLARGTRELALDLRLDMGRHWLKLLGTLAGVDVAAATAQYLGRYAIRAPDPSAAQDAPYCAQPEVWSTFAAIAGRRVDGGALYLYLTGGPGRHASDGIPALAGREADADALAVRFLAWFEQLIAQPPTPASGGTRDAWLPNRLEYQFNLSAPDREAEKVFAAEEYFHGHLDWYNLDLHETAQSLDPEAPEEPGLPKVVIQTLVPAPVTFEGMPHSRWWTFEDGQTNFGEVKPDSTDLAKLLLMEFGLVFANDWFLVPCTVAAGSVIGLAGVAVTTVFGERTWVQAAGSGADEDWQRWAMFLLNRRGDANVAADTSLLVLPTAQKVLEGPALEEVLLVRDEMANMVWAVENTIWLPTGEPGQGAEAARDLRAFLERDLVSRLGGVPPEPPPAAENARIRYQVMSSVPEHWIPFVPVHMPGNVREIQLQRAAMPRILEGDPERPRKVQPRTALAREGLDRVPASTYFLHEEEVPRAGVRVTQRFERTRWRDGRAWVWLAVRKQTGRGEAESGLGFDRIVNVPDRARGV
jgi:hypothetical protein